MRDFRSFICRFSSEYFTEPCFVTSSRFVITIYCFEDEEMIVAVNAIA